MYEGPISLHANQHLLLLMFLMIAIPDGVRYNLKLVLMCVPLIAEDVEIFLSFLAVCISSFENFLFRSVGLQNENYSIFN